MRLGILNMPHRIVGQVGIKIKTSIAGGKESTPVEENIESVRFPQLGRERERHNSFLCRSF